MLRELIERHLGQTVEVVQARDELTIIIPSVSLIEIATQLRDQADFQFEMLMDLCGVDYLHFGSESETESESQSQRPRFSVVYHLLSLSHHHRIRLKVNLEGDPPTLPSVVPIWPSANWYEREAFDLFGIVFEGHPDLRRILTDYHFEGHPLRKDFPVSGHVEVRYDETQKRLVYEPVSIEPRDPVPKVITKDLRYV